MPQNQGLSRTTIKGDGLWLLSFAHVVEYLPSAWGGFSPCLNQTSHPGFGRNLTACKRRRGRRNELSEAAQPKRRRQIPDGSTTDSALRVENTARDEREFAERNGRRRRATGRRAAREA